MKTNIMFTYCVNQIIKIVDIALTVDSKSTARIQEAHRTIYHVICELVEKNLTM